MMCSYLSAKSFSYGRGNGPRPCTCNCYTDECEEETDLDITYDFFNLKKENRRIENSNDFLVANINSINAMGLLEISFNNVIDLDLLRSIKGKFLINDNLLDIYINPSKERLDYPALNTLNFNFTWEVV